MSIYLFYFIQQTTTRLVHYLLSKNESGVSVDSFHTYHTMVLIEITKGRPILLLLKLEKPVKSHALFE